MERGGGHSTRCTHIVYENLKKPPRHPVESLLGPSFSPPTELIFELNLTTLTTNATATATVIKLLTAATNRTDHARARVFPRVDTGAVGNASVRLSRRRGGMGGHIYDTWS